MQDIFINIMLLPDSEEFYKKKRNLVVVLQFLESRKYTIKVIFLSIFQTFWHLLVQMWYIEQKIFLHQSNFSSFVLSFFSNIKNILLKGHKYGRKEILNLKLFSLRQKSICIYLKYKGKIKKVS